MRRSVARRLHAQAREIHSRPGRQTENKLVAVKMSRGSACMSRLRWQRWEQVKLLMGKGMPRQIAELTVPQVATHALTARCTGPRATYKFLKRLYRESQNKKEFLSS